MALPLALQVLLTAAALQGIDHGVEEAAWQAAFPAAAQVVPRPAFPVPPQREEPLSGPGEPGAQELPALGQRRSVFRDLLLDLAWLGARAESEYYLLKEPLPASFSREQQQEALVAVVVLRRIERPGETLFEREVTFREGGVRIHHTEACSGSGRRLVWREFLPARSRTWVAAWSSDGAPGRTIAYGWNRPVHEALPVSPSGTSSVVGPLELLHAVRSGPLAGRTSFGIVDPSAGRVVDANASLEDGEWTVRRTDESLVFGGVVLGAEDLSRMRWSAGAASLERIDRAEFGRHRRRWAVESRRPYEAILASLPSGREAGPR